MSNQDASYAPRSPDLSGYHLEQTPAMIQSPAFYTPQQPSSYQNTYLPPANAGPIPPYANRYSSSSPGNLSPNHGSRRLKTEPDMDQEFQPEVKAATGRKSKKQKVEVDYGTKPAPGVEEGIEVKTKFPVARIKRIMQADEDVGKVAQVTPTAVSKALELFMISLVTKAASQAKAKSAKKVTAAHLKQAVQSDEQFDFLAEIMSKVPDAPAPKNGDDSEGAGTEKKKRGPARRKRKEEELE